MGKKTKFVKDAGLGIGGTIFLVLALIVVFGGLAYFFLNHGDSLSLPSEQEIIAAQKAQQ